MQSTNEQLLQQVNQVLSQAAIFYLSNDPERALGLEKALNNFHVVHIDLSPYLEYFSSFGVNYFCLEKELGNMNQVFRSSLRLVKHDFFQKYFTEHKAQINYFQTFKVSPAFALAVKQLGGKLLNTTALLNRMFEDKLLQIEHLHKLPINLPKYQVVNLAQADYQQLVNDLGADLVVQFARGHTGSGTIFVKNQDQFEQLKVSFPNRQVRISEFVKGEAYTLNACVAKQGIFMAGLSYQITGITELTPATGGTVGNDWEYPQKLSYELKQEIIKQVTTIGEYMCKQGYLGLFGVDLIIAEQGVKVIEINARQPASIPMWTKIQLKQEQVPLSLLHLLEFLQIPYQLDPKEYNSQGMEAVPYSQVFLRAQADQTVNNQIKMGAYRLQSDNAAIDRKTQTVVPNTIFLDEERDKPLIFTKEAYAIDELSQEILILPVSKGKIVKQNQELARMQLPEGAIMENNHLKPWILEALVAINHYLK